MELLIAAIIIGFLIVGFLILMRAFEPVSDMMDRAQGLPTAAEGRAARANIRQIKADMRAMIAEKLQKSRNYAATRGATAPCPTCTPVGPPADDLMRAAYYWLDCPDSEMNDGACIEGWRKPEPPAGTR